MKKILGIVTGAKEEVQTTQLNENMEGCGMSSPMSSMPNTPPVTMSVNLNAQGIDQIKDLLSLMNKADSPLAPGAVPNGAMPMPSVGMDMPIKVTKIGGDMDDKPTAMLGKDSGMAQIRDLISKADKPEEAYANEPDEEYADMSASIPSGDDLHKQKSMHRPAAGGDNPMAVREETIRQQLDVMWKEIKEGAPMEPRDFSTTPDGVNTVGYKTNIKTPDVGNFQKHIGKILTLYSEVPADRALGDQMMKSQDGRYGPQTHELSRKAHDAIDKKIEVLKSMIEKDPAMAKYMPSLEKNKAMLIKLSRQSDQSQGWR